MCGDSVYLRGLEAPSANWIWPMDVTGKNHLWTCPKFKGWRDSKPSASQAYNKWVERTKKESDRNPKNFISRDEALAKMKRDSSRNLR